MSVTFVIFVGKPLSCSVAPDFVVGSLHLIAVNTEKPLPVTSPAHQRFLAFAYLTAWLVVGLIAVPLFRRIFAEWLDGASLPGPTITLLRGGPVGCLLIGIVGASYLLVADKILPSAAWRRALLVFLCLVLAGTVALLLWPLVTRPS